MEDGCGWVVLPCRISTDSAEIFNMSLRNAVYMIQPQQELCVVISDHAIVEARHERPPQSM